MARCTRTSALVGALLLAGLAGCAGSPPDGPGLPATNGTALGAKYGACPDADTEVSVDARAFLVDVAAWHQVTRVTKAEKQAKGATHTLPAEVEGPDGTPITVAIHDSYWPGIDWGLQNSATVWFGLADPAVMDAGTVAVVLVATPSGEVFFPGECQDRLLGQALHQSLGARADRVLASVPTIDDETARVELGLVGPAPTADPPVLLNPSDVSTDVLESLDSVTMNVSITAPLGEGEMSPSLCTRIAEGWNECLMTDERTVSGHKRFANYLGDDRHLEFWLLDEHADVTRPVGYLGAFDVPPGHDHLDVVVDTADLDLASLPDRAGDEDSGRLTVTSR